MDITCNNHGSNALSIALGNTRHAGTLTFSPPRATDVALLAIDSPQPHASDKTASVIRREQRLLLALAAVAHAAAVFGLARLEGQPGEPALAPPIVVSLLEAPPAPVAPEPAPPAPAPVTLPPIVETTPEPPAPPLPAPEPAPHPTPKPRPALKRVPAPVAPAVEASTNAAQLAPSTPMATAPTPASKAPAAAPPAIEVIPARFDAAYLNNPRPSYPPLARRLNEQGTVMLRVRVAPDGTPGNIEIATSSGSRRLDSSAEQAVSRWQFVPATQGGQNVPAWVIVPVVFKLEGL